MNIEIMEYLVPQKTTRKSLVIKSLVWAVFPVCIYWFILGYSWVLFIGLAVFILAKIFVFPMTSVEYEYLYCDRRITVDVIYNQEKRKTLMEISLDRIELMAPMDSHRLDSYKNRKGTTLNYWSLEESEQHKPYMIIYEGNQRIILDLPPEFVKMVQNNAPRKVFTD